MFVRYLVGNRLKILKQVCVTGAAYSTVNLRKMAEVKTIKDLGYAFNAEGKLRKINENGEPGEEPFQFNISDKHQECQEHYEEIGEAVTHHVYDLLENQEKLIKMPVPIDAEPGKGTFIFASKDYDTKETLLVLIHGSGVVRAGQWARSIIINENLDMGTQIPYIRKGLEKGYGVMVLNTNDNYTVDDEKIKKSQTPEEHGIYVWNNYVEKTKSKNILIVAHSYGGVVTVTLAKKLKKQFEERVKAIALTDSVHGFSGNTISDFLKEISKNWVASVEPLDTSVRSPKHDITRVSAGHKKHEMTSYSCMESVFKFFDEKLNQ